MSYCVNCGVELAESEKCCPLCHVEVINPDLPWKEPDERPYSHHYETLMKRVDRRYFATLIGLFLLIPVFITVLYDALSARGLSWSLFVVGAVALLYTIIFLPFYYKKYHTAIFMPINCAAVLLYLLLIERMSGGNWFIGIGMPITVAISICVIALAVLFSKKIIKTFLLKAASLLIAAGIIVVCIELFINLRAFKAIVIRWSFYVMIPCVVLGIVAMILEHRKNLKEEIRRRLFY